MSARRCVIACGREWVSVCNHLERGVAVGFVSAVDARAGESEVGIGGRSQGGWGVQAVKRGQRFNPQP